MNLDKKKLKIILFCVLISVAQISFSAIDYNENVKMIGKAVRYFIYFSLFAINVTELKKEDFNIKYILLMLLSGIIFYFSRKTYVLLTVLIIWSMRKVEFKEILKYALPTMFITFVAIIALSLVGIIPNWSSERADGGIRYYLGYQFATIPSTYFFVILLTRFYQKGKDIKLEEIIFELLISIYLYLKTDSRTGFYLSFVVLATIAIYKYADKLNIKKVIEKKSFKKFLKKLCVSLPIIMLIISVLMIVFYGIGNSYALKINQSLSGRLKYTLKGLLKYDIKPFGSNVTWNGWGGYGHITIENFDYNFVDNSYIYLLIDCGAIFLTVFTIAYTLLLVHAYKKNDYKLIIVLSLILIWSLIEPNILNIDKNLFLLLFAEILEINLLKDIKNEKNISIWNDG